MTASILLRGSECGFVFYRTLGDDNLRVAAAGDIATFLDRVGDHPAHQRVGPDRIVVSGNRELDDIGVDVGVDDSDDRNAELVGLGDGDVFFLGVEDEDRVRSLVHAANAAQVLLQLLELAAEQQRFLLRHRVELAGHAHAFVLLHLGDPLGDGLEVGEHATKPTLVHVRHTRLLGVAADGILGLLLGTDEHDRATLGRQITGEVVRGLDTGEGLLEIDDVDPAALTEDEPLHLRVPPPGLVSEVDARFQHLPHGDDCHDLSLSRLAAHLTQRRTT